MGELPDAWTRDQLQRKYGQHWRIWQAGSFWVATVRDARAKTEPTIMEKDLETFEARLEAPSPWGNINLPQADL